MLTLTPPRSALDARTLTAPGGFAWWYADVVDADGSGVVVIAAYGLPFLARRGERDTPIARPSINVAVYERGICTFYALQELPVGGPAERDRALQEACAWSDGAPQRGDERTLQVGASTLHLGRTAGGDGEILNYLAEIDITLPTGSLRGTLKVEGAARLHPPDGVGHQPHTLGTPATYEDAAAIAHDWSPQTGIAHGHAALTIVAPDGSARDVVVDGSAYLDRNGGLLPMTDLGIGWWLWARADVDVGGGAQESRIVYALWPEDGGPPSCVGVSTDERGHSRVVDVDVHQDDVARTWLGMREVRRFTATEKATGTTFMVGEVVHRVDDGPFYLRHTLRAGVAAASADVRGTVEVVDATKLDRRWQRPFVAMRVTPSSPSRASLWHPLFSGPKEGRVARQLGWLTGGRP